MRVANRLQADIGFYVESDINLLDLREESVKGMALGGVIYVGFDIKPVVRLQAIRHPQLGWSNE
jgi:hypothetical protein